MIVLDSSFVLAALLPDERTQFVRSVLMATAAGQHAPALLPFEISHVLSRKHRRGEITLLERDALLRALEGQMISFAPAPSGATVRAIAELAVNHRLNGYDAAYLELALRLEAQLATLDDDLAKAARETGLTVHYIAHP